MPAGQVCSEGSVVPGERPLLRHERQILSRVTGVDWDGAAELRASLPYLVRTAGCGCGCASFDVRDTRFAEQQPGLEEWCHAADRDGVGVVVYLGPEGRLKSVDVDRPATGMFPRAAEMTVVRPDEPVGDRRQAVLVSEGGRGVHGHLG